MEGGCVDWQLNVETRCTKERGCFSMVCESRTSPSAASATGVVAGPTGTSSRLALSAKAASGAATVLGRLGSFISGGARADDSWQKPPLVCTVKKSDQRER